VLTSRGADDLNAATNCHPEFDRQKPRSIPSVVCGWGKAACDSGGLGYRGAFIIAGQRKMGNRCSMHYESVKGCTEEAVVSAFGATTPCFLLCVDSIGGEICECFLLFRKARKFRGGQTRA